MLGKSNYPSCLFYRHSRYTWSKYNTIHTLGMSGNMDRVWSYRHAEEVRLMEAWKEGNVLLFKDARNTFYLRLYGVGHNYGKGPFR